MLCRCRFVANGSMLRKWFDDAPGLTRELRPALGQRIYGAITLTRGCAIRNVFETQRI